MNENEIDLSVSMLRKEHVAFGLRLRGVPEDDLVILYLDGKAVRAWPAHAVELETIIHEADQSLEASRNGVSYE